MLYVSSDPPMAWLLAKTWIPSSNFQLHQLQPHILRGPLMAEVISVATMRSVPGLQPVSEVFQPLFVLYLTASHPTPLSLGRHLHGPHLGVC